MKKKEFLKELRKNIQGLPENDINERIDFYSEAIDDRMEEGLSEDEAVAAIGSVDDVVNDIAGDTSLVKLVKNKVTPKKRLSGGVILLLILGFPLWLPLLLTAFVLLLFAYLLTWVLVIVSYAVEVGLLGYSAIGLLTFGYLFMQGEKYWLILFYLSPKCRPIPVI